MKGPIMRKAVFMFSALLTLAFAASAAEFNLVPNRLAAANPGEWATLGNLSDPGELVKVSVVDKVCENGEWVLGIKREYIDAEGKVVETKDRRVRMSRYQERLDKLDQRANRISRERMTINGRDITVYVVEWEDEENDREIKIWLSHDIPVGGFVRIWSSDPDFPTYEIVDFGTE